MITCGSVDVTYKDVDASRIPDALVEGTSLLLDLRRRGVVDEVAKRLKIRRQGGFCGLDVWLTLLLYMTMGAEVGVRKFWEVARPHVTALAALAGRRRLPSPASLSRALDAVEPELLRGETSWLLTGIADVDAVLRHPVVESYDARGDGWHVFDSTRRSRRCAIGRCPSTRTSRNRCETRRTRPHQVTPDASAATCSSGA